MTSRIVVLTKAGKETPKYVQAFLRPYHSAATATAAAAAAAAAAQKPASTAAATMLMSHTRKSPAVASVALHPYLWNISNSSISSISSSQMRFMSDKTTSSPPPPVEEEEKATPEGEEPAAADVSKEGEEAGAGNGNGNEGEGTEPQMSREEQLEAELREAKDALLRSLAEQENTRRIAKKDVADARNFAVKSFAKSLLDVSDNLHRALEAVPENMRNDTENHATLANLYEGIKMTEMGLTKAFEMNGLKTFGAPGDAFDPNKHEALYEYPDSEKEAGTVGQLIKVGYTLNNRVLRPAEVGVVKKE